ncbi:hypothetical protein [Aeromonas phage PZL-Ah8]|uniref:Sf6-type phage tail needle knob domain-containing protein n=1 Tax=Aeromonas phage PZL-Ah8 TaxID=2870529 RepID=A0AAE8XBE6_9CAUD|nr:hypothetical protein [Aeromonas phage PZL-Ah8]
MSNPSNVEFGWNETVGYTKYGDQYKLLYVKPTLSFQFKILFYSTFGAETYEYIQMDGQAGTLTPQQLAEVNAYAISVSTDSNWDFKIPNEVLKGASLSGSILKFQRQDGTEVSVPIGGIIPNTLIDSVVLSGSNLKFIRHGGDEFTIESQHIVGPHVRTRKKTEVKATGTAFSMQSGQSYNVVDLLASLGIDSGELEPLFKQTGKILKPYNTESDVHFKIVLLGTWSGGGGSTRSMELNVGTATENRFIQNRSDAVTSDSFTFNSMIAVDVGGPAATSGVSFNVKPNGGNFSLTTISVIATQLVLPSDTQLP